MVHLHIAEEYFFKPKVFSEILSMGANEIYRPCDGKMAKSAVLIKDTAILNPHITDTEYWQKFFVA